MHFPARELCVKAPWETRPVTTKAELGEGCLHQGETVERDKLPAALHQPAQVQNRGKKSRLSLQINNLLLGGLSFAF